MPDAVDFDKFSKRPHTFKSILPENLVNILYAGHLYDYKGIPEILKAAKQLPDFLFHLVGGLDADIERQRERIRESKLENVILHGMQPHTEIPKYLWIADVLLLTHTMNHPSAQFTSPVKLGEYLASGTPTIVADIPALRDWVSEKEVWFYEADSAKNLVNCLELLTSKSYLPNTKLRIKASIEYASSLSYEKRIDKILE